MRVGFQIVLALYLGLLTIYAGAINFVDPSLVLASAYNLELSHLEIGVQQAYATQIRIFSALWVVAGVSVLLCVRKFESHSGIIRLVLFGTTLGVIGQLVSVYNLSGDLTKITVKCVMTIAICLALETWRMSLLKNTR